MADLPNPSYSPFTSPATPPSPLPSPDHMRPLSSPALSTYSSTTQSSYPIQPSKRNSRGISYFIKASETDRSRAERLAIEKSSSNIPKGATAVLSQIADGSVENVTPGFVQALFDLGAEVCFERRKSSNLIKVIRNKDQTDIRSDLLQRATRNCPHEILFLLAQHADETALDQALPISVAQNDLEKTRILLARGANVTPLCSLFLEAVEFASDVIVYELTRPLKGACQDCRDRGLVRAATIGHGKKVQILLDRGADVNFDNASALRVANRSGREDIAMLIVSHSSVTQMRPDLLDWAVGDAYAHSKHQVLKACLRAGAIGPSETMDRTLLKAVVHSQFDLVDALVQSHASIEYEGGAPIVAAAGSGQPRLLQAVISGGKASQSSMAAAVAQVMKLGDVRVIHHMVDVLLSAGLRGDAVSRTLIRILDKRLTVCDENSRLGLASLLLHKGGADVNYQQGQVLILAAAEGWVDILGLLIRYEPSITSLEAAMAPIMRLEDLEKTTIMIDMIIGAGPSSPAVVERLGDAAVASAAEALRLDVLQYLAHSCLTASAILAGFAAAISSKDRWVTPPGLAILQFFLDQGVIGSPIDEAFCRATRLLAQDAVEMLVRFVSPECINRAFRGMIEESPEWHAPDDSNLWLVQFLLEWGASGEPVNIALLYALNAFVKGHASADLLDILLTTSDVNFQHAEALKIAIRGGDVQLLGKLASNGASRESITHAFSEVIITNLEEDKVLQLLDVLVDREPQDRPDFEKTLPDRCPPIFDCLAIHPNSVKLIDRLISLGCDVDATIFARIHDTEKPEPATALTWALSRTDNGNARQISSAVIKALIDAKANIHYTAELSHATPLIMAAKHRRGDIVKRLIKEKVDTRYHDAFDKSALFYASRAGDIDAVTALLKVDFRPNDGSLHEAARNLHTDCVVALIKANYDTNFHSSRAEYEGRTPLQEMVYRCDGATRKVADMEATIWALFEKGKANPLDKWQGMTSLFLALRNKTPYPVTQALLNTSPWCQSNHPSNVIVVKDPATGVTCHASPTVYLRQAPPSDLNAQLDKLLQTMGCEDRYYAILGGEQPAGAVGLPDDIAKEVKRQHDEEEKWRKSEFEHREKLRRANEEVQLKHALWQTQELEKTAQKINQSAMLHETQLHQHAQMTVQQREALIQKNKLAEEARLRVAFISQATLQTQQQLKLGFQQQTATVKLSLEEQQKRLAMESAQQKLAVQKTQNMLAEDASNQKMVNAQRMQALMATEQRRKLQNKKAMHKHELAYQRSLQDLKMKR